MKTSLYIYPWDILDYGVERCLDMLEDTGVDQISIATTYHTEKLLLPHNPKRSIYFTEPGLCYFPPDQNKYPGLLKPAEAKLTRGTDFLEELTEKAGTRGIDVIAWVVCMHNSRLGMMHPEVTVETATGDKLIHTFCPVNPETRAYVTGLVSDLNGRYRFRAVELESASFMGYFHGYHHEISGIDIPPSLDFLLSLCFCQSCMKNASAAGIDMDTLRGHVKNHIALELEKPHLPDMPREIVSLIPGLEAFIDWRVGEIDDLVDSIKQNACRDRELIAIATVFPPNADARIVNGADPCTLTSVCDTVAISGYFAKPTELEADLDTLEGMGLNFETFRAGLRPQAPDSYNYENFLSKLKLLRERNFSAVALYNFGTMRKSNFEWIRNGLSDVSR